MGTHFSFLFPIYFENHGVQAEPFNFSRSSDITYVAALKAAHGDQRQYAMGYNKFYYHTTMYSLFVCPQR